MQLFDTHAHLDDSKYDEDREAMLQRARDKGVKYICNVGFDLESSLRSVKLAEEYPFIYAAVGIHPHDAETLDEKVFASLEQLIENPRVVAIGEIGLDYYRDLSPREVQKEAFRRQVEWAAKVGKPIIVHDRDAHGDVMHMLQLAGELGVTGVLHCFSGSWEMAKECLKLGFYISFAGPVTFKNSPKLAEVAKQVPLDRLLVETDSPYLTPEPFRGKRNESAYVFHTAEKVAQLREMELTQLAEVATENALRIFGISHN